ncbi:hypothetical protein DC3_00540 [Deinococcus cellulosilyticus NBRC 106333 = KACC 11606]|uniref:MFS transporter n=2 Tax=Deinococcus cellulosilyticus TaxID=401558 RepID=A0A511MV12_DEIC1|nr:hypothetical protein DC3_00540 [Deinococcus cellulosilyticus NBRC 106333 = KACC 11606]
MYLSSLTFSTLSDAATVVVLPYLVLPHAGTQGLGWVLSASTLPRFFAPLLGTLADRMHLKLPLVVVLLLRALLLIGVAQGSEHLWWVCVAGAINGLLATFSGTASSALVPALAGEDRLKQANTLLTGISMGLPLAGYGLAGMLMGHMEPSMLLFGCAGLTLLAVVPLLFMAFPERQSSVPVHFMLDLKQGLFELFRLQGSVVLMLLSGMLNLMLASLNTLMPGHFVDLGLGAKGYGWFEAGISVGALLGMVLSGLLPQKHMSKQLIAGATLMGIAAPLCWLNLTPVWLGAAGMLGTGLSLLEIAAVTALQLMLPAEHRAKSFGVIMGINSLCLSGAGLISPLFAPLPYLLGMGLLVLVLGWLRGLQQEHMPLKPTSPS